MLAWLLQPHGYETLQATTGKEGIEKGSPGNPVSSSWIFAYPT